MFIIINILMKMKRFCQIFFFNIFLNVTIATKNLSQTAHEGSTTIILVFKKVFS